MKCVKVTWPTGAVHVETLADFLRNVTEDPATNAFFSEWYVGDSWSFELIEMAEEEYNNLPEFTGP